MRPIRLFYIPNEQNEGDQIGPRKAFGKLLNDGELGAYAAYSYYVERKKRSTHHEALDHLREAVDAFQPDLIFWQHLNKNYPVDREFLCSLKAVASKPKFVWHDPDAYGRFVKRIDPVMKAAIAESDAVVIKALGAFADSVRSLGAKRIVFSPESFDDERFSQPWTPTFEREYDVVMIANLSTLKRIPWLFMPGGRARKRLARLLYRNHQDRFAVFGGGRGWLGERYCKGPIKFADQERTMRTSWVTVNWTQFDALPMYFSDRLPISMASGVPHITNYQPGVEHVLPDAKGVYFARSPQEAADLTTMLLSETRERLIEIGAECAAYARTNLCATKVYGDLIRSLKEKLF